MSDTLLFVAGAVVFMISSVGVLWYGYLRFASAYEEDAAEAAGPA